MRRDDDVEDGGPISHGKISSLQLHMRDDEREEERESSVVGLGKITEIMTAAKQQLGDPAEICGKGERRGAGRKVGQQLLHHVGARNITVMRRI